MPSTASTVVEQIDSDMELAQLVKNYYEIPQRVTPDLDPPPLRVVATDSLLPTHVLPPRAHTLPPAYDPDPYNRNRTTASRAEASFQTRVTEQTWFLHVEKYASVIGIVIAVVAIAVTVIGIIVGVIVAVTVK